MMARRFPRRILALVFLAATMLAALRLGGMAFGADDEKGILASVISKALSSPGSTVSVGAVDGALSSDATISDITIADKDGVWLKLDKARLIWSRTALLLRRLEVDKLEIGKLEILRKPVPAAGAAPAADGPLLPELPLKVEVKSFALAELALGAPLLGVPARLSATGKASLGAPSEGLDLTLDVKRLDAPGAISVRGSFVPQSKALQTVIKADEPAGGLVARLANLPGLPPVTLDLDGKGTLDAFNANLAFRAGDTIGADGTLKLQAADAGARDLGLDLQSRIEGLLPPLAAPVFAGTTRLTGSVRFEGDGGIAVNGVTLAATLARLDIAGRYGADKSLDFTLGAASVPNAGSHTAAGGTSIGKLALTATIKGQALAPRVDARVEAADASVPQGRLKSLLMTFNAVPSGTLGDKDARLSLNADGDIAGLALADPGLKQAVGDQVTFRLRGNVDGLGIGHFETLRLATRSDAVHFAGAAGAHTLDGTLQASLGDLAHFSTLAGRTLAGSATLSASLKGDTAGSVSASLDGKAENLASGIAALDGLTGGRLALGGTITRAPSERYTARDVKLAGAHVTALADGTITPDTTDLTLSAQLPELARADKRLSGRAALAAHLTGPQQALNATVDASLDDARALNRPVPHLALTATLKDLQGALEARLGLTGSVDGKPARGTIEAHRVAAGGWALPALDVSVGSVALKGGLTLLPAGLVEGSVALTAGNLDDLSALALTPLRGSLDARIGLSTADGAQAATVSAKGRQLALAGNSIADLALDAAVADALRRPVVNARARVGKAVLGGQTVTSIALDSQGNPQGSAMTLSAKAQGFDLAATGLLVPADQPRLELSRFTARRSGREIRLAQPAVFTVLDKGIGIAGLRLAIERGLVSLDGTAGEKLDLTLAAKAVPLSAARIFAPQLDLAGTLEAQARLGGSAAVPTGTWRLAMAGLSAPQTRSAGLPPLSVQATGTLGDGRTTLDASLKAGQAANLTARGSVPLQGKGALDLAVKGKLDAAMANAQLAAGGRRVSGAVSIDMAVKGTTAAPQVSGGASLANGTFTDALQGVQLKAISAQVTARGTDITISQASATARNGGTLSASGSIVVDPAAGFPARLQVKGNNAELVANGLVTAVADLALDITGPVAQRPRIAGRVKLVTAEVKVPDSEPINLKPVKGIRHVNATPTVKARLAAKRKAMRLRDDRARRAAPFNADLAITVAAPSRIFVRGRGIDAELGGEVRISGTLQDPAVNGAFDLRRGRLQILSQRLDITRGRLTFNGDIDPQLDFVAQTRTTDVTANIMVTGSAAQPTFAFSSQPDLPQDEILSRILFSKASGSLSAFQALQLAQSAAQLAGGGDDTFERLRKSLGVDNLDVQYGANGPTVGVSRYIGSNLSVGFKTGAKPEESGVSVGLDVTKHLKLQVEGQANGAASAGVGAEWEY